MMINDGAFVSAARHPVLGERVRTKNHVKETIRAARRPISVVKFAGYSRIVEAINLLKDKLENAIKEYRN